MRGFTERWVRIVGLVTWLVAGSTSIVHFISHPGEPGVPAWAAAYSAFVVTLWVASETRLKKSLRITALAGQAALAALLAYLGMPLFEGALLALVAAQTPTILPLWGCIVWASAQALPLGAILSRTYTPLETTKSITSYLGFSAFAVAAVYFFEAERRARIDRDRTVSELIAIQALLEESTRVAERVRISRDLHDVLGHHLVALSLHLDLTRRTAEGEARTGLDEMYFSVKRMLSDARKAVHELHDEAAINLSVNIHAMAGTIRGVKVNVDVPDSLTVADRPRAQAAFRCVQEAVTNALKHAEAKTIWIAAKREAGVLTVHVEDDGRGIGDSPPGVGLRAMRARILELGGTLEIEARPEGGTKVCARIPLPDDD